MAVGAYSQTAQQQIAAAQRNYQTQLAAVNIRNAAGGASRAASSASPALASQSAAINALKYQPIDIAALTKSAEEQAARNVATSIGLEQQYAPGVAATRTGLQDQVASNLAMGGNLPADTQTQVARNVGAMAGASGLSASAGPITAASLGLTSLDLQRQRMADAGALLSQNPLPTSGLDPGAIADLSVANTTAANQFALSKLGAQTNLANSMTAAQQAQDEAAAVASTPYTFSALPYQPVQPSQPVRLGLSGLPEGQLSDRDKLYHQRSDAIVNRNKKTASRT